MDDIKQTLRIEARRHRARQAVNPHDHERAADLFFEHFMPSPNQVIAAYMPMTGEFDPHPIIARAQQSGIMCALPVIEEGTRLLRFAPYMKDTALKEGRYGILEPDTPKAINPDVILVPALLFDRAGYRLGQGGGYYDTTLAKHTNAQVIGIGYDYQIRSAPLPVDKHDHKMAAIITPQEVITFS